MMFGRLCFKLNNPMVLRHRPCTRKLTTHPVLNIFDRNLKRLQRERAALLPDPGLYEYLREDAGYNIVDRVCDIKRSFDLMLDLGCGRGFVSPHVTREVAHAVVQCDLCRAWVEQSRVSPEVPTDKSVVDDENLPFRNDVFDIVVSSLNLHWVNDLPRCFQAIRNCLVADGVFLGSVFCDDTLFELRSSLQMAELQRENGFGPHLSPFTTPRDLAGLLQQTGFTLLTIDTDETVVSYPSIYELMRDLRGMGETNCSYKRKLTLRRGTIKAAGEIYAREYGNGDNSIPATFQIANFIGWKPHPGQATPAKRGSGTMSIKDLDKLDAVIQGTRNTDTNNFIQNLKDFTSNLKNTDK